MAKEGRERIIRANGGRPAKISREQILEAARQLGDEVSFSRIAARLGVRQPALYYHFKSRDELLDALMAELAREFAPAPGRPQRWRSWLEQTALDFYDFLLANPSMFAVENWRGVAVLGLHLIEVVLETLEGAGYSVEQAGRTWEAIGHMAYSQARLVYEVRRAGAGLVAAGRRAPRPGPRARAWGARIDKDPRKEFAKTLHWIVAVLPRPRS
jgi:TetR/AcrR family tetracycline transcriptional repressor